MIYGFLTPEVRKGGKRIGFDIEDIYNHEFHKLARVGEYNTQYKLGKYRIFTEEFDKVISSLEEVNPTMVDLFIIDEIGKMELYSSQFQTLIKNLFNSDNQIIATIGQKLNHPIKDFLLKNQEIILLYLNRENQEKIFNKIISVIS